MFSSRYPSSQIAAERGGVVMKKELESIIETLKQAKRQVSDMKKSNGSSDPTEIDDVELALDWALNKLNTLNNHDGHDEPKK